MFEYEQEQFRKQEKYLQETEGLYLSLLGKLQAEPDENVVGMELLHLFVRELLGRKTAASIIFDTKTNEE
jgi:hypothetical protein